MHLGIDSTLSELYLRDEQHSSKTYSLIWCFDYSVQKSHIMCSEELVVTVAAIVYDFLHSSNHSATPCALWISALSSWKRIEMFHGRVKVRRSEVFCIDLQ